MFIGSCSELFSYTVRELPLSKDSGKSAPRVKPVRGRPSEASSASSIGQPPIQKARPAVKEAIPYKAMPRRPGSAGGRSSASGGSRGTGTRDDPIDLVQNPSSEDVQDPSSQVHRAAPAVAGAFDGPRPRGTVRHFIGGGDEFVTVTAPPPGAEPSDSAQGNLGGVDGEDPAAGPRGPFQVPKMSMDQDALFRAMMDRPDHGVLPRHSRLDESVNENPTDWSGFHRGSAGPPRRERPPHEEDESQSLRLTGAHGGWRQSLLPFSPW